MGAEKSLYIIAGLLLILCSSTFIQHQPGDTIVGTWISQPKENSKWVFSDSTAKIYYQDKLDGSYIYTISRTLDHCGYDVSDRLQKYPDESILTLTNAQTSEKECYYVYSISIDHLSLSPFGSSTFLFFAKQQ